MNEIRENQQNFLNEINLRLNDINKFYEIRNGQSQEFSQIASKFNEKVLSYFQGLLDCLQDVSVKNLIQNELKENLQHCADVYKESYIHLMNYVRQLEKIQFFMFNKVEILLSLYNDSETELKYYKKNNEPLQNENIKLKRIIQEYKRNELILKKKISQNNEAPFLINNAVAIFNSLDNNLTKRAENNFEINSLKKIINESKEKIEELNQNIEKIGLEKEILIEEKKQLQSDVSNIRSSNLQLKISMAESEDTIKSLKKEVDIQKGNATKFSASNEVLREDNKKLTSELSESQDKRDKMTKAAAHWNQECKKKVEEIKSLQEELDVYKSMVQNQNKEGGSNELQLKLQETEEKLIEKEKEEAELKDRIELLVNQIDLLKAKLSKVTNNEKSQPIPPPETEEPLIAEMQTFENEDHSDHDQENKSEGETNEASHENEQHGTGNENENEQHETDHENDIDHQENEIDQHENESEHQENESEHQENENDIDHQENEIDHQENESEHQENENEHQENENEHQENENEHQENDSEHQENEIDQQENESEHQENESEHQENESEHQESENDHQANENEPNETDLANESGHQENENEQHESDHETKNDDVNEEQEYLDNTGQAQENDNELDGNVDDEPENENESNLQQDETYEQEKADENEINFGQDQNELENWPDNINQQDEIDINDPENNQFVNLDVDENKQNFESEGDPLDQNQELGQNEED